MNFQSFTTSSGPWDEKYPQLDPGNPGLPSPIATEPIVYPENPGDPGDPFIMKPVSHSWVDVSEMILHCVHRNRCLQNIEYHPIHDQLLQLYQFITSYRDLKIVLSNYTKIYNRLFFGGMVKSSAVEDSTDDEIKIIFDLELVSDVTRAGELMLNLDDTLGLAKGVLDGRINRVTIYIVDVLTLHPERDYHEVVSEMLGTLAHEMIHAMQLMYTPYPSNRLGVIYAPHGTSFQKAAQAIEQATRDPSGGEGLIYPKIDLGRESGVYYDVKDLGYKKPTDTEIRNMGLDVEYFRGIL